MFTLRALPNLAPPLPADLWDAGRHSTLSSGHTRAQHAVLTAQRMLDNAERDPAARQPHINEAALIFEREQRMATLLAAVRQTGMDTPALQPTGTATSPPRDTVDPGSRSRGPEHERHLPEAAGHLAFDDEPGSSNMSDVSTSSGLTGIEMY